MKNRDNLHFRWSKALTYNKTWNFVIGERESGKSVDSWLTIWRAFHYDNRPSIVLRRRIADITSVYIDDIQNVLNKFLDEPIQLVYKKGDIKQGIIDVKIGKGNVEYSWKQIEKLPLFVRIIGLSNPMSRIKSLMVNDIKYIFFDEFIVNLRGNEKYLTADEYFLVQEIYTTYNREASTPIRFIAAANPYSVYCPFFNGLGVDTRKLKPGAFVVGDNYVIDCFAVPPELKAKILAANPMYQFDDAYKRYAFNGEAVNDANIRIHKCEPRGFKLRMVFKLGRDYISIHQGVSQDGTFNYWCCKHSEDWLAKVSKTRRKIVVFNFGDMIDGSVRFDRDIAMQTMAIKDAMNKRKITYNCIDAQYMLEDVYSAM